MSAPRVRVEGAAEASATIARIGEDVAKPPQGIGAMLAEYVALEAPVATGYLRSTVTAEPAGVVVTAPYAVYVEASQGFVARGAARARGAITEAWQHHADDVIRREGAQ